MGLTHFFIGLLALTCLSNALSSVEVTKAKKDEEIFLRHMYSDMNKGVKNLVRDNLKYVFRFMEENSHEFNLSTQCMGNALKLLSGLRDLKFWAVNFVDASAKLSDGILDGSFLMYGNYDQCLNASAFKRSGEVDFRGRYCLITVGPHLPKTELTPIMRERANLVRNLTQDLAEVISFMTYRAALYAPHLPKFGLCVPSGCDTYDINQLVKYVSKRFWLNVTLDYCDIEDSLIYFTPERIVILCICILFILLAIISSVIEQYSTARSIKFNNPLIKSLLCFSILHNFQKFKSTKITEGNLTFLNGVRVLTLFYVILAHHYILKLGLSVHRNHMSKMFITWAQRFFYQILCNGFFTVDVFFFIGGFLNCYMRAKKNFTSFSIPASFMILIHRLMRIYPVYIIVILLNLVLIPRGPFAHEIQSYFWEPCRTHWWKNLLFINNYNINPDYQCIIHSWYLAADTQFFLVSLFTIPLLFRYKKIGVLMNLVIIVLSMAFTLYRHWTHKLVPTGVPSMELSPIDFKDMTKLYFLPYPHSSAYFGGILLGFIIAKKKSFNLSKKMLVLGWIIAIPTFLTMLFYSKRWNSGVPYTRLEAAFFFTFSRLLYSWSVGWLIFCCFTGNGGFINHVLSWKIWIVLNRLCLSAFLLSAILQLYYYGNIRTAQDFQHEIDIWGYFGDLAVTCLMAIPVVLLFESPFIALEKVIFNRRENTPEAKGNEMKAKKIINHENCTKK